MNFGVEERKSGGSFNNVAKAVGQRETGLEELIMERNVSDGNDSSVVPKSLFAEFGVTKDFGDGDFVGMHIRINMERHIIIKAVNDTAKKVEVMAEVGDCHWGKSPDKQEKENKEKGKNVREGER